MSEFTKRDTPLYVVSDLHIGSGKKRDAFSSPQKIAQFHDFLDMVEREDGQLLILGDFLDLWRFSFKGIVKHHNELLARLGEMDCHLIPGNHDLAMSDPAYHKNRMPVFGKIIQPFSLQIGERDIAFWHGHEVDMMNKFIKPSFGKTLGRSAVPIEWLAKGQVFNSDVFHEQYMRLEAFFLSFWNTIIDAFGDTEMPLDKLCPEQIFKTLSREHNHKRIKLYEDQARAEGKTIISAHTHQAGTFDDWYFNSGSWTTQKSDFLRIWPNGKIDVLRWMGETHQINDRILA
ncbi:MAG: metallophosphoesterase [Phycisphaerae bacterium]|jgi:UDP-2,3-diacylglucosamine pyrophosphatase LpxH